MGDTCGTGNFSAELPIVEELVVSTPTSVNSSRWQVDGVVFSRIAAQIRMFGIRHDTRYYAPQRGAHREGYGDGVLRPAEETHARPTRSELCGT